MTKQKGPGKSEIKVRTIDQVLAGEAGVNLMAWVNGAGVRVPVDVGSSGICARIDLPHLVMAIRQLCKRCFDAGLSTHYYMSGSEAKDIAMTAIACCPVIEEPSAFRFRGETKAAYAELPFTPSFGMTPNWDKILKDITNSESLKAYVGSLFYPESYRQQYLWIYGKGGDGKGCLTRWLEDIFGTACTTIGEIDEKDKFFAAQIAYARLVVVTDFQRYSYPATGHFRRLSGGDSVMFEKKYQDAYNVRPVFKFIFTSNELPQLSSLPADQRRAIICEATAGNAKVDTTFEGRLKAESAAFIHDCMETYRRIAMIDGKHEKIPFKDENIEAWTQLREEPYEDFFNECFCLSADSAGFVTAAELNAAVEKKWGTNRTESHRFVMWLKAKGIKKAKIRIKGKPNQVWAYLGVNFNPDISSLKYRPSNLISGSVRRKAEPSEWDRNRLTLLKNDTDENLRDENLNTLSD